MSNLMFQRITHPRLMQMVARYRFNALGRIDLAVITQDSVSGENIVSYVTNPSYQAILCQVEPVVGPDEVRRADMTVVKDAFTVMLDRAIPELTPSSRLTIDNGDVHNIITAQVDSLHSHTNLITEIIRNG